MSRGLNHDTADEVLCVGRCQSRMFEFDNQQSDQSTMLNHGIIFKQLIRAGHKVLPAQ